MLSFLKSNFNYKNRTYKKFCLYDSNIEVTIYKIVHIMYAPDNVPTIKMIKKDNT